MKSFLLVVPSLLTALALSPEERTAADASGDARPAESAATALAWGDLDGDGLADVLAILPGGLSSALRNAGGGRFEPFPDEVGLATLPRLRIAAWRDFDGDGALDLLTVSSAGELALLHNQGGALLALGDHAGLPADPVVDARWADVDGDERADLVVLEPAGYAFYRNAGAARFERAGELLSPTVALAGETPAAALPPEALDPASPGGGSGENGGSTREQRPATRATGASAGPGGRLVAGGESAAAPDVLGPYADVSFCAPQVADVSTGSCLQAGSQPALGRLYPLSLDLNVDAQGDVGIGTSSPTTKLQVLGLGKTAISAVSDTSALSVVTTTTSSTVPALRVGSGSGGLAGFLDGALQVGVRVLGGGGFFVDRTRLQMRVDGSQNGVLELFDGADAETVEIDSEFSSGGRVSVRRETGSLGVDLNGGLGTTGGLIGVHQENGIETVQVLGSEVAGNGAQLTMRTFAGTRTFEVDAEGGSLGAVIDVYGVNGNETMELRAEQAAGQGSKLTMYRGNGTATVELAAEELAGQGAQLLLRRSDGTATITLDADTSGDGVITAGVLQITGGADLVESFDTREASIEPGSVLVIDPSAPGALRLACSPYDERVAGVASGANGVRPGLRLGQAGTLDGDTPVALTGRVWVRSSAENGAIEPGDLLTTSATPGHAMRATDRERAFGAVLGKALTGLTDERGMVLVLVGLQ